MMRPSKLRDAPYEVESIERKPVSPPLRPIARKCEGCEESFLCEGRVRLCQNCRAGNRKKASQKWSGLRSEITLLKHQVDQLKREVQMMSAAFCGAKVKAARTGREA